MVSVDPGGGAASVGTEESDISCVIGVRAASASRSVIRFGGRNGREGAGGGQERAL